MTRDDEEIVLVIDGQQFVALGPPTESIDLYGRRLLIYESSAHRYASLGNTGMADLLRQVYCELVRLHYSNTICSGVWDTAELLDTSPDAAEFPGIIKAADLVCSLQSWAMRLEATLNLKKCDNDRAYYQNDWHIILRMASRLLLDNYKTLGG